MSRYIINEGIRKKNGKNNETQTMGIFNFTCDD